MLTSILLQTILVSADEDEEHDEDEELRLALEVSLADMNVRDSQ